MDRILACTHLKQNKNKKIEKNAFVPCIIHGRYTANGKSVVRKGFTMIVGKRTDVKAISSKVGSWEAVLKGEDWGGYTAGGGGCYSEFSDQGHTTEPRRTRWRLRQRKSPLPPPPLLIAAAA